MKRTVFAALIAAALPWSSAVRAEDPAIASLRAEFEQKLHALQADYEARLKALENRVQTAETQADTARATAQTAAATAEQTAPFRLLSFV